MNRVRLADASLEFKNFLKEKGHSTSTIVAYGKDIEQLVDFLDKIGKKNVDEVTQADIEAFLAKMNNEGYTPKSISRKINSTRTFYRFLKLNGYVKEDPSLLVAHPKY